MRKAFWSDLLDPPALCARRSRSAKETVDKDVPLQLGRYSRSFFQRERSSTAKNFHLEPVAP